MILCATMLSGLCLWLFKAPATPGNRSRTGKVPNARSVAFRRARKNQAGDAEDYAKFVRQLSALLRAGCSNSAALELLEKIWVDTPGSSGNDIHAGCARALTHMRTGGLLRAGFTAHATESKAQARLWTRLGWCFAISERSGAALADLLDQLAGDLECAADMRRALDTALAGPRATSRLLAFLPLAGLGLGQLLGINPVAVLTTEPIGRAALLAGALLWLANRWWCRLMLAKILSQAPS